MATSRRKRTTKRSTKRSSTAARARRAPSRSNRSRARSPRVREQVLRVVVEQAGPAPDPVQQLTQPQKPKRNRF